MGSAETLCTGFLALPIIAIVRTFSRGLGGALTRAAEVHISAVHLLDSLCVGSRLGSARGVALQRFNESGLCTLMVFHHRVRLLCSLLVRLSRSLSLAKSPLLGLMLLTPLLRGSLAPRSSVRL